MDIISQKPEKVMHWDEPKKNFLSHDINHSHATIIAGLTGCIPLAKIYPVDPSFPDYSGQLFDPKPATC
jgi:hypothetical protein